MGATIYISDNEANVIFKTIDLINNHIEGGLDDNIEAELIADKELLENIYNKYIKNKK